MGLEKSHVLLLIMRTHNISDQNRDNVQQPQQP